MANNPIKPKAAKQLDHPLVGMYFHEVRNLKVQRQGHVDAFLGDGLFLVTYFEWIAGSADFGHYVLSINSTPWDSRTRTGFVFYNSEEEFKEAWESKWKYKGHTEDEGHAPEGNYSAE